MQNIINDAKFERLCELSALSFEKDEKEKLKTDIQNIVTMLGKCAQIDTDDELPNCCQTIDELRQDSVTKSLPNDKVLLNAPKARKGYFNVPKVVD